LLDVRGFVIVVLGCWVLGVGVCRLVCVVVGVLMMLVILGFGWGLVGRWLCV